MLHMVIFLLLFMVVYSLYTKEPFMEEVLPVSFPNTEMIKLPSEVVTQTDNQTGMVVKGPALLGIEGGGADVTYIEANQNHLLFNSAGYDQSSDAALYADDNGMTLRAGSVHLNSEVKTGTIRAVSAKASSLKVARTGLDEFPQWGEAIYTTNLYANGPVATGKNGEVAASFQENGDISAVLLRTPLVYGETLACNINGTEKDFLQEIDRMNIAVQDLRSQVAVRNMNRELKAAIAYAAAHRGGGGGGICTIS
jgi:hypothetical protein